MINKKKSILFCLIFFVGQLQNAENKSWIQKTGAWIQKKLSPKSKTHPLQSVDQNTFPMTTVSLITTPHTIKNSITYATTQKPPLTDGNFEENQDNNKMPLYSQPQRKKPAQKDSTYILVEPAHNNYDLRNDKETGIYAETQGQKTSKENTIRSIKPQYTVEVQNIAYSKKPDESAVIVKTTTTKETFEIPYDQEEDEEGYIAAPPASPELQRSRQPLPSTPPSSPKQKTATKERTSPQTKKQGNKEIELLTDHTYLDSSMFEGERHPSVEAQQRRREPEAAKSPAAQRKYPGRR